ncbi:MAG: hypothetical protein AAGH41_12950 [Pseudomonadota bacterium]
MANQFVAFMDERHGLGAWVAEQVAADLFRNTADAPKARPTKSKRKKGKKDQADMAGRAVSSADLSLSLLGSGTERRYGGQAPVAQAQAPSVSSQAYKTWTSPRASAEATSAAVIAGQAQVGVLPFYEETTGFNTETLSALIDFRQDVVAEYVAESNYVLAVPTDLIHEVDQAGFTNSFEGQGSRSFQWTADKQRKYRNRIGTVLASPDAMRHCAAAIDGMRARGIEVQQLPEGIDSYRAGLEQAHARLDPNREVATTYGPNGQQRVSKTKASNHAKPLIGVLIAFDKALGDGGYCFDNDYTVMEAEMAGADRVRTSFIATTQQLEGEPTPPLAYQVPIFGQAARWLMDHWSERARADMEVMKRYFSRRPSYQLLQTSGTRTIPGMDSRRGLPNRETEPYPYARIVYALPTVGQSARDPSKVLAKLADFGLSYRVQPLENRPGKPIVVAIDVPNGHLQSLKPAIKAIRAHKGSERLATFPAVTPMVPEGVRTKPFVPRSFRVLFKSAALIGGLLTAFVAGSLVLGNF